MVGTGMAKRSTYWQVRLPSASLDRFKSRIGFFHPVKAIKLGTLFPNRWISRFNGYDEVVKVEPIGLDLPMIDLELPSPHLVGFGAFLGKNTQGLSLDQVQIDYRGRFFGNPASLYVAVSRCRTPEGLRLVGLPDVFSKRCIVDKEIEPWL